MDVNLALTIGGIVASIGAAWGVTKAMMANHDKRLDNIDGKDGELPKLQSAQLLTQATVETLEKRQEEDRRANKEQHEVFYPAKYLAEKHENEINGPSGLFAMLREIQTDIKELLKR